MARPPSALSRVSSFGAGRAAIPAAGAQRSGGGTTYCKIHNSILTDDAHGKLRCTACCKPTDLDDSFEGKVAASQSKVSGLRSAVPIIESAKQSLETMSRVVTPMDRQKYGALTFQAEDAMTPLIINATKLIFLSYEDLEKLAVCEVSVPHPIGRASPGDTRMGTLEDNEVCGTCNKTNMDCPGHLGIIRLNRWYLNPKAAPQAIYVLQCVCNCCGRLLISEDEVQRQGFNNMRDIVRLQKMAEVCVKMQCMHHLSPMSEVGTPRRQQCERNPIYNAGNIKGNYLVMYEYRRPRQSKASSKDSQIEKDIGEIDKIFRQIPAGDLKLLGFEDKAHPRNFILKAFPVIPPVARPRTIRDGEVKYDYLTTSYCDIIRYNNLLDQYKYNNDIDSEKKRREYTRCLYFFISHFIDNTDGKYTRCKNEPIQSVVQRFGDKTGIIRSNASGKRVNFSARSVLGPNSRLRFGQFAFPDQMRKVMTTEVVVTAQNIERLTLMYKAGHVTHVSRGHGLLKGRQFLVNDYILQNYSPQIGDRLDRYAQDGDPSLFNRQPTLSKFSMMSFDSVYFKTKTFGMHPSYTTPTNADNDGDEGNKHIMQSIGAKVEARCISHVTQNVMNTQSNRPSMGMIYNSISSSYMISTYKGTLDEEDWNTAMQYLDASTIKEIQGQVAGIPSLSERLAKHKVPERSGRALFSTVLPHNFDYTMGEVKIRDGVLIEGRLTKKHVGPSAGSIVQYLWKLYTKKRVAQFFTECQFVCDWFIQYHGLSVGYRDCIASDPGAVRRLIDMQMAKSRLTIEGLGGKRPDMTALEKEAYEKQIQNALDNVQVIGQNISKSLPLTNPLNIMGLSGAKGNENNTAQIVGLLGQQFIKDERPRKILSGGRRALIYCEMDSDDIEDRGFIPENFMIGMRPKGTMFHMMSSRIGLINTAVTTSKIGHINRRLIKNLEDFVIAYDGSVRNASMIIFQYCPTDGFNAGELLPTHSDALGTTISFIDLRQACQSLNAKTSQQYDYV